ncbi:MAG: hypothetical protein KDA52_17590 [Planctomycetaceae bacterium]|nr:hypothetical protein [Planctomycetaceae bacterium]
MRRTPTVLFCIVVICLTGFAMAQDDFPDASGSLFDDGSLRVDDAIPVPPQAPTQQLFPIPLDYEASLQRSNFRRPGTPTLTSDEARLQGRIAQATKYVTSKIPEESERATTELESAVTEFFELRANERLKQIEELEQRVAKLRDQMERREEKKSEIIQLQVQTHINQANGLGF